MSYFCQPHLEPVSPKGKGCTKCNKERDDRTQKILERRAARKAYREEVAEAKKGGQ